MDMLDPTLDHTGDPDGKGDSPGPESHVQLHGDSVEGIVSNHYADESLVAGQSIALDPTTNIHYQLRPEPGSQGQVTYRVVQVTQPLEGGGDATQVIASPFSNGNSPTDDSQPETRFTYFPNATTADVTQAAADVATIPVGQVSAAGGQFYVMMSPPDVLQGPSRSIAPRTHSYTPKMEGARTTRDERRRATHNEVERRRRDKINNWIVQLSKLVPDCAAELKQGGIRNSESKGGILSKACDYILELRQTNNSLAESLKETERLRVDGELLRQQCEELKQENALLRTQLQQHGIVPAEITGTTGSVS